MQAKSAAGFKTQAAIAERIADDEGLDSPPKDAVNRAFRELPVEHQTLERIARALGVRSETLLPDAEPAGEPAAATGPVAWTPDEPAAQHPPTHREPAARALSSAQPAMAPPLAEKPPASRWPMVGAFVVAACVALVVAFLARAPSLDDQALQGFVVEAFKPLNSGTASLAILPIDFPDSAALDAALREGLSQKFKLASMTATALNVSAGGGIETDAELGIEIVQVGRRLGLIAYLSSDRLRRQVFATSLPVIDFAAAQADLARRTTLAVRAAIGAAKAPAEPFPMHSALLDYLHGQLHLDQPANELNIRRAQSRFQSALRADSNFARAHAGLCRALLEEYWMDDEQRALRDAELPCAQALQLAPTDPVVLVAHARFLQVTGRNEQAIGKYQQLLETHPNDADALTGLAVSQLHAFQASGEADRLDIAAAAARRAAQADQSVWKPLYYLGTIEVMANRVDAAVAALKAGLARDENEYLLVNYGTYLTCNGQFTDAKRAYERAQDLAAGAYVGDEFMGQLHYFLGEFEEAVRLRQKAVDSFPGGQPRVHEMWGDLGDALRQVGRKKDALAAYRQAAEIAEQDIMGGNGRASDEAARAYYYSALDALAPNLLPRQVLDVLYAKLDDIAAAQVDPVGFRRMAMTYARRGDVPRARDALAKATSRCKGYARHPDLQHLMGADEAVVPVDGT